LGISLSQRLNREYNLIKDFIIEGMFAGIAGFANDFVLRKGFVGTAASGLRKEEVSFTLVWLNASTASKSVLSE